MITYAAALTHLRKVFTGLATTERVTITDGLHKVAAAEVCSTFALPQFCCSAMDGFAVQSVALTWAQPQTPIRLKVLATVAAGDSPHDGTTSVDTAVKIMTGAVLPAGYDAVVPIEEVVEEQEGAVVACSKPVVAHQYVRAIGSDIQKGQVIVQKQDTITAAQIMLLAALGETHLWVYRVPPIYFFSTGKELIESLGAGQDAALQAGKIFNATAPYLLAQAVQSDYKAYYGNGDGMGVIAAEDAQKEALLFREKICALPIGSVIVSTGAVSMGQWDYIPDTLLKLGAVIHFHRVAVRPGKPILCATLPNGNHFFGLPGNPISAAVGWHFFILPAMRYLQGLSNPLPIPAVLTKAYKKSHDLHAFLKAHISINAKAQLEVTILPDQESYKIGSFAVANAWVILGEAQCLYHRGSVVDVLPFAYIPCNTA